MRRWFRYSLALLFGLLILEVVVFSPKRLEQPGKDATSQGGLVTRELASQHMEDVHLIETTGGEREWDLRARTALAFKGTEDWQINQVTTTFFGDDDLTIVVTGKEGIVRSRSKNVEITGDVKVLASNGYQYLSDKVIYISKERMLSSPGAVRIVGSHHIDRHSLKLTGGNMFMNIGTGSIKLGSPVAGEVLLSQGRSANIQCLEAEFSARSYFARFIGKVVITYKPMRIRGPEALFNYHKDSKLLESIDLRGGVKVTDVDKWASAERVHIVVADDKFIFRGSPRLVQDNDELRGDEIIFSDGGARVKVVKGRAKIEEGELEKVN